MKLQEALEECTLALLRRIASNHQVAVDDTTLRAEIIGQVAQRLMSPGYLEDFLVGLSKAEKSLLGSVRSGGWMMKAFVIDRQFPVPSRGERTEDRSEASPRISLIQKGILYRSFAPLGSWRGEVYHVPEELQIILANVLPGDETPSFDLKARPTPEIVDERNGPLELFCLMSAIRRGSQRLTHDSLSPADIRKLESEVRQIYPKSADKRLDERWRFLIHLSLANGWLIRVGSSIRPTRNVLKILAGTHAEVRERLLEGYFKDYHWSDLAAVGKVRQELGSRRIDEVTARKLLLHHLKELSGGSWIDVRDFADALRRTNPDFLREDYASPAWGIVDVATEAEVYGPQSWDVVEGRWLSYVLHGPFYWIGAVRFGKSANGGADLIQCVSQEDGDVGATVDTINISPELQVAAPAGVDLALLYRLEPYMELSSRGAVSYYRMTKTSVLEALEAGHSWDELKLLLQSPIGISVGDGVRNKIEGWVAEYGRYLLEAVVIIRASNPEDLERLSTIPQVAAYLGPSIGNSCIRVDPGRLSGMLKAMKSAGLYPRVDPTAKRLALHGAYGDFDTLRESLFALKLVQKLHAGVELKNSGNAVRRLEAALEPEEVEEISRRVNQAAKRLVARGRIESGEAF